MGVIFAAPPGADEAVKITWQRSKSRAASGAHGDFGHRNRGGVFTLRLRRLHYPIFATMIALRASYEL